MKQTFWSQILLLLNAQKNFHIILLRSLLQIKAELLNEIVNALQHYHFIFLLHLSVIFISGLHLHAQYSCFGSAKSEV